MRRFLHCFVLVFCVMALMMPDAAEAAKKKNSRVKAQVTRGRVVVKKGKRVARETLPRTRLASAEVNSGAEDERYAAVIMNPVTGEIYHEVDADGQRYPASLTKMMTLYLLFDALEQKKLSLSSRMEVSEYAAGMPQTNLHLSSGDSIPVETAIKALVVRSANDVAVVVAEALAGDADRFARMMTAKARALGMNDTVFQNPNGLPDSDQHTSALDMAKLGIALKRDFPRYYPYFSTRQFSWNGATYYTHNRVMLRYAGVDGIKTGYVRASGFNLVTSVKRGGRPLIGVVMGGSSGRWRDDRMIALLDATYQKIAERGSSKGKTYSENLPAALNGKGNAGISGGVANEAEPASEAATLSDEEIGASTDDDDSVGNAATPRPKEAKPVAETTPSAAVEPSKKEPPKSFIRYVPPAKPAQPPSAPIAEAPAAVTSVQVAPKTSPFNAAPASTVNPSAAPASPATADNWGIQVGAFSSHELAAKAIAQAAQTAHTSLAGGTMDILGPEVGAAPVHRARMTHLSVNQARAACETLIANHTPCFIFKAD